MINTPHNPSYRLVETTVFLNNRFLTLVYGITNDNTNEGLEIYFKKSKDFHFYKSFRYTLETLPKKYLNYFEFLKQFVIDNMVNDGCKIIVELSLN